MPYKDPEAKRARDRARYHEKKEAAEHAEAQRLKAEQRDPAPQGMPLDLRALAMVNALQRLRLARSSHQIGPGVRSWFSRRWSRCGKYTGAKLRQIRATRAR